MDGELRRESCRGLETLSIGNQVNGCFKQENGEGSGLAGYTRRKKGQSSKEVRQRSFDDVPRGKGAGGTATTREVACRIKRGRLGCKRRGTF